MELRRGVCYVIEGETSDVAYRLFREIVPELGAGFCIARLHPEKVRKRLGPTQARLGWLAEAPGDDHFSANATASLAKAIVQFVSEHQSSGVVLVDGLEYVILHNGFQPTLLAFVEPVNEFIMGTQAIVLLALRPQTQDPREVALLERNLQVLRGPEVRRQLDMEEVGDLLVRAPDADENVKGESGLPKVLSLGPDMIGPKVGTVRCARCGTENADDVAYCVYCGSNLTGPAPEPATVEAPPRPRSSAVKPIPRSLRGPDERRPDFVGLIGVAFFLLIVGIVFALNTGLITDLQGWWNSAQASGLPDGLFVRPPSGVITSGMFFFGLLGLSNFLTSGLRWILDRSRFGALARVFAGIGFFAFAGLIWRYSLGLMSGSQVLSIWTATLGTLLVVYIATGLYWVRARRPVPAGSQAPTLRP
jgi:hypothetical protein